MLMLIKHNTKNIFNIFLIFIFCISVLADNVAENCFCKLEGEVDDCSCTVDSVDSFNNLKIFPRLQSLLCKDYFKFYKVNLNKKCPFWSDDSRCALKDCHVDECNQDQLPSGFKQDYKKYNEESNKENSCDDENEDDNKGTLGKLDHTISHEDKEAFKNWVKHDNEQDNFCEIDDENGEGWQYVDLVINPERFTGYTGFSAARVWKSIYNENCFNHRNDKIDYSTYTQYKNKNDDIFSNSNSQVLNDFLSKSKVKQPVLEDNCLEKRVFYRLISGLHTSINTHLTAMWQFKDHFKGTISWGQNPEEFQRRFSPKTTNGEGPQWLKNLYFAYLVELRAISKASPYLKKELYFTGNPIEDDEVRKAIGDLLTIANSFQFHFDEMKLFKGKTEQVIKLKEEFKTHFRNISKIMDCVGCDKCRLWGKLQIQGMGTALKILFSGENNQLKLNEPNEHFQLTRNEIVSLFNAFGRLSKSINEIDNFRKILKM